MKERSLDLELDLSEFFADVVDETLQGRAEEPLPIVRQYLVGLLEDSALSSGEGPIESVLGAPLAVQLAHALEAPPADRFERLRGLGDGILVLGGIYAPYLKRAGLEDHYAAALGARAYASASSLIANSSGSPLVGASFPDLLGRMASKFSTLMILLRDVSDTIFAGTISSAGGLAQLYERWFERRSKHLEYLLSQKGCPVDALIVC